MATTKGKSMNLTHDVVTWPATHYVFLPSLGVHGPLAVSAPRKHSHRLHHSSHKRQETPAAMRCNSILRMRRF